MTIAAAPVQCGDIDRDVPIDRQWLEAQCPALAGGSRHLRDYLENGLAQGIDPTRWFSTDWYAWQNPDWSERFRAPYLHYLDVGRAEGRDPSAFVDVTRFRAVVGDHVPAEAVYGMICAGFRSVALGVYADADELRSRQRAFMDGISVLAHRVTRPLQTRRALVVLQAGRKTLARDWMREPSRDWDLLVNHYDAEGYRADVGEYAIFQKGTKFTAMKVLWDRFPALLAPYDHVLFLDDDVVVGVGELNALFRDCRAHQLDLAQMSLTAGSSCNWQALFHRSGQTKPRALSAVEIMMPVFSRAALSWIAPTLGKSVSGFGLDLVWGKIVRDRGGRVAVLDGVSATHARPVDQSGGAYYSYLRRHALNAKAELWALLQEYDAPREMACLD